MNSVSAGVCREHCRNKPLPSEEGTIGRFKVVSPVSQDQILVLTVSTGCSQPDETARGRACMLYAVWCMLSYCLSNHSTADTRKTLFPNPEFLPLTQPPKTRSRTDPVWGRNLVCYMTEFAPQDTLKLIAWCKFTFDERVVLYRVVSRSDQTG